MSPTAVQISLPERYRVLHHIATGGMAAVYAAADELLAREVAVKVLAPALSDDPAARERFAREARAAARLSHHPHVVAVYDVGEIGEEEGGPSSFIVMELLRGGTVNDRLKAGAPIPHALALEWLAGAAGALDAAHAAGMVHRDVKPANLLLDADGRTLKVGDFGIATLSDDAGLTQTGQVVGTAAYFSPEQARGRPATAASDRYALAVVAYELLTGRRPFREAAPAAQALAHIEREPEPPSTVAPNLPPAVDAVLAEGLAKDPAARPASATALVERLTAAVGPTAATAVAPSRRFARRTAVAGAAGVAVPDPDRPPTPRPAAAAPDVVRSSYSSRRGSRLGALAAAAALLLIVGAGLAAALGGGDGDGGRVATAGPKKAAKHRVARRHRTAATSRNTGAAAAAATTTASDPLADARAAQSRAHALIGAGRLDEAIGILRGVVEDCDVAITDPCAWAWFDLGHALRLAGSPQEAIPVLEHRLRNPDQRDVVQAELDLARREAAAAAAPAPKADKDLPPGHAKKGEHGPPPGHGHGPKHEDD